MRFEYQKDSSLNLEKALATEWLETNGLGGYASSTILNNHSRKYHGLLVSKLNSLPDKYVLLSKVEDVFIQDGKENCLTSHSYPDFLQKGSFDNLEEFVFETHPVWKFKLSDAVLTKEILMIHDENTVLIKYRVEGDKNHKFTLRPLIAWRNFHKLQCENAGLQGEFTGLVNGFSCASSKNELPELFFQTDANHSFLSQELWYRDFIYQKEKERGYDFQEDLYSPGIMIFDFNSEQEIIFSCSTVEQQGSFLHKWQKELQRRSSANKTNTAKNRLQRQLHKVGQEFVIENLENKRYESIVAGYHWFLEWGRDAMISLPGLTLYSQQENLCLEVLRTFAGFETQGLIPNILGKDKETSVYNTVDASLWFVWAVQQYYLKTNDLDEVATTFWQVIKNIFKFYKDGTLYNIKMDNSGLLFAGSPDVNLTWMDAIVNGKPITPRYGYQVEINSLWFNMLSFMAEIASKIGDPIRKSLKQLLENIKQSFRETFWCEEKGYLYDFVNKEQKNSALRPNQIFAVSLPYSPLTLEMAVNIVNIVREKLLTPYGLRTLAQAEKGYVGNYSGDQAARDRAYHNGTVWPWLLGHFTEALLKTTSDKVKVTKILHPCLEALEKHLGEYGIGSIAEIFSGDEPHKSNGCISQAWSVAEVLRLTYLLGITGVNK